MEGATKKACPCNYRAHARDEREVPIRYADYDSGRYHEAKMCNRSEGGMYFESEHAPRPGTDIWIKLTDYSADVYGPEACDGYRAEVMWCRELPGGNGKTRYGIGVRFIVNTCDQCGGDFCYRDMHKKDNFLMLCSGCVRHMGGIAGGKLGGTVENYLMGNVL